MKFLKDWSGCFLLMVACLLQQCGQVNKSASVPAATESTYYSINDFSTVKKFDTHVHINVIDTTLIKQARADNFRLLTVNVTPAYYPPVAEQQRIAVQMVHAYPELLAYATSFSLNNWGSDKWQSNTLAYLKESFDKGAIAVKVWKNIGMELKDKNGKFVMVDDPRFDTIFNYIEEKHIPVLGHLGEPRNAWLPVEKMTVNGDKNYFSKHPEYHMYLHPEYPSYDDQIRARDHLLEKHPNLKFIGAHLGSLEWSVEELGKRLDKFPNMAVDIAARLSALQYQTVTNHEKVRQFLINYQDRLIYGTDLQANGTVNVPELEQHVHDSWLRDWTFFVSDTTLHSTGFDAAFKGMKLPRSVVDKIFRLNAIKWFPGIDKNSDRLSAISSKNQGKENL